MQRQDSRRVRPRLHFGVAAILSLFVTIFALGVSAVASASPVNASGRHATPAVNLSGSEWLIYWHWKNDQKKGPCAENFHRNGAFIDCDGTSGTWSQSGDQVTIHYPSCNETWTATYDKPLQKFLGSMQSPSCNESGAFYLDKTANITAVTFAGAPTGLGSPPTVTVEGSGFGSEPASEPSPCGGTGMDFPSDDFYMSDKLAGWNAGAPGNCTGLVVQTYSGSEVAFSFGSNYDAAPDYDILNGGDKLDLDINGQTIIALVTYPSAGTDPSKGPGD